jgi:hypothetical protein
VREEEKMRRRIEGWQISKLDRKAVAGVRCVGV